MDDGLSGEPGWRSFQNFGGLPAPGSRAVDEPWQKLGMNLRAAEQTAVQISPR